MQHVEQENPLLDKALHFTRGKMRVFLSWVALYFLIVSIHSLPNIWGLAVMFIGATIRFVASGFIDKEGRLSVAGPYAYVRNPLYLGSILIAVGAALAQGNVWLVIGFTIASIGMHLPIIWAEERVLSKKFGEVYLEFKARVPRLFPWKLISSAKELLKYPNINAPHFSWSKCIHNKAYEAYFVFLAIALLQVGVYYAKENSGGLGQTICSVTSLFCSVNN